MIDPALNVPCPTCRVPAHQPCISRHAISLHQARREALADLSKQATSLLKQSGHKHRNRRNRKPRRSV